MYLKLLIFRYLNYLELVPKLFETDTFIFLFYRKTRTNPEQLIYFWRTSTGTDTDKFKRFQPCNLNAQTLFVSKGYATIQ